MAKYRNALTGDMVIIYPWSKKEEKVKVQGKDWYELIEE